ncbi:hypothetical protein M6D93_10780 [Jatrophihabitans telluris]|uniref:Uncharacterized protein n=1 Tax=Jatrophihabitans telluris TaxID=2038343 RepID=A0ABY4QU40_9ACTN|nr:hypothetical protein [Jatrophihabitans telluris]UQX86792.1 hypothetical protein M6D93_10780 [Jatrophihabitans telluris]
MDEPLDPVDDLDLAVPAWVQQATGDAPPPPGSPGAIALDLPAAAATNETWVLPRLPGPEPDSSPPPPYLPPSQPPSQPSFQPSFQPPSQPSFQPPSQPPSQPAPRRDPNRSRGPGRSGLIAAGAVVLVLLIAIAVGVALTQSSTSPSASRPSATARATATSTSLARTPGPSTKPSSPKSAPSKTIAPAASLVAPAGPARTTAYGVRTMQGALGQGATDAGETAALQSCGATQGPVQSIADATAKWTLTLAAFPCASAAKARTAVVGQIMTERQSGATPVASPSTAVHVYALAARPGCQSYTVGRYLSGSKWVALKLCSNGSADPGAVLTSYIKLLFAARYSPS